MTDEVGAAYDQRVLVFSPVSQDAVRTCDLMRRARIPCHVCETIGEVSREFERGAGALMLTKEALDDPELSDLASTLRQQPPWSDVPVLLVSSGDRSHAVLHTLRLFEMLGNVTLLDRPIRATAVISVARAALRARARQYEMRDVLLALRTARDEAEAANRLKDEFLATLSHELRTPLNAILGWVSMLRRSPIATDRLPNILEVIERNAKAQADLISEVLDVSRIITGRLRLNPESVLVPELVTYAIESIRPAAEAKALTVVVHAADAVRPIHGDRERLQQVLWNLLSNAVKFTPAGGRIDIEVRNRDSEVEIAVSDTGIGLASDFVPFAFDRFRQADQSFTRTHGGLGLGLSIVKHIVELHGGRVSVESGGPGNGATFRVTLPVEGLTPASPPRSPDDCALSQIDLGGRAILVVDDDPSTRELLSEVLTHCHARVMIADSARAALEQVEGETPALVIADIGMPGEDGLTMMARVRKLPHDRGGDVPAIALSAYARAEDRTAALSAGFNEFLTKPATAEDVLRTVQQLLG